MFVSFVAAALIAATSAQPCAFGGEPESWTRAALESWERLDRERIRMPDPLTPTMLLFDQACLYRFTPSAEGVFRAGGRTYSVSFSPHDGMIDLPDGGQIPARKLSFAAPSENGGMFFVMGLPALWRADQKDARDPDLLAMVVFMHEFAHTQQGSGLGRRLDDMARRGLPSDADDDTLQANWSETPDYASAYKLELDLLYQAAVAASDDDARRLLADAAAGMAARRDKFLTIQPVWREADDVFLTLEGSGNWAARTWLSDPHGGGLSAEAATAFVRGSGHRWSQDQGLGVMLALDRLTPDWPSLTFGPEGTTADTLITRALNQP